MTSATPRSPAKPVIVKRKPRFPVIWILPAIALAAAVWMVYQAEFNKGPIITIEFDNAEGLQAGKTKLKSRSVDVGMVEEIQLNETYSKAIVKARVMKPFVGLLREDSEVWVLKPRIGNDGISGMSTLLSGAYIEIKPGTGKSQKLHFIGLEHPPVMVPDEATGLHIQLQSDDASSISTGDPVLYKGFRVGTILAANFQHEDRSFVYDAFIENAYEDLVCDASRFWNTSGVRVGYGVDGLKIDVNSLETLITGGVTFDLPEGINKGKPVSDGYQFRLFDSYEDVLTQPYHHYAEYLLLFNTSVAGLTVGAPVEYRGIQIGTVTDIAMHYLSSNNAFTLGEVPIPVKIRIDPGRLHYEDSEEGVATIRQHMVDRVAFGAKASLAVGSLLTGSRFITFDYIESDEPATIGKLGDYETLPTINRGITQIEEQLSQLLNKLNSLELKETLGSLDVTMADIRDFTHHFNGTLANVDSLLTDEATRKMPEGINRAIQQLEITLAGVDPSSPTLQNFNALLLELRQVSRELSDYAEILTNQPNALIFSGSNQQDPQPPKPQLNR